MGIPLHLVFDENGSSSTQVGRKEVTTDRRRSPFGVLPATDSIIIIIIPLDQQVLV